MRLIVLHTAEGATTIESLGRFFQSTAVQASSHCGADDTPNTVGEYVHRTDKAWTVAEYNPVSVNLELCAFAAWSRAEWMKHPHMLENCAHWIAEEAAAFKLPIVKLTAAEAQGSGRGVCQHRDLGVAGGGHHDCGDGFPIDHVLELANGSSSRPDTGTALAAVACHLERKTNIWEVHGTPAQGVNFGGPDKWDEAVVGVNLKTGKWRIHRK